MQDIRRLSLTLAALALVGCHTASPPVPGLAQLQDRVVAQSAPTEAVGALGITIRQAERKGYQVQYLRDLDWEVAEATLSNTASDIPPLNRTVNATVGANNERTATLLFSPIRPSGNYTIALTLKKKNPDGTYKDIATGSSTNVTLGTGANTVTVTLTPTAQGELLVDVSDPSVVLNTVTTTVDTRSHFDVLRVAGTDAGGNTLGTSPATAAFKELSGIDVDASGTLYVADAGNHQIRRVPTSGASTLVAGDVAGASGFAGDTLNATTALLASPRGLTRDPVSGNIVFCDSGNDRVRTISSDDNFIYTIAGGGADTAASVSYAINAALDEPFGIASDTTGDMFVTERGRGRVVRLSADGILTTVAQLTAGALGPVAIDRARNLLWVGDGATVKVISDIHGASPAVNATTVFTASGAGSPVVTGLAYDQVGTLYVMQAGSTGSSSVRLYRVPVNTNGLVHSTRQAEVIAGTGGTSGTMGDYLVPTSAVPNALSQLLAGASWCSLAINTNASQSASTVAALYAGNSYPGAWGHLVRLTPATLNP